MAFIIEIEGGETDTVSLSYVVNSLHLTFRYKKTCAEDTSGEIDAVPENGCRFISIALPHT